VRRIEQEVVRQGEQPLGQRPVERAGHLLDGLLAVCMQVGTAGVSDQKRIARQREPWVVDTGPVRDEVGVMGAGMTGSGDGLDDRVAQLDDAAVG
jgi:hypothetical protein